MDANSTAPQGDTLPALLLHAGYMSGATFPHERYERERLMREQRERDKQEATNILLTSYHALGLR